MPPPADDRPRLGDQHYGITDAAIRSYAEHERLSHEDARTDLEDILRDARRSATDPTRWRLRSKTTGLDLSLVTRDDDDRGHLVVVALTVRDERQSSTRPPSYERRQLRRATERETVAPSGRAAPLRRDAGGNAGDASRASARPDARVVVDVAMTEADHAEIHAERRDGETVADVLLSSGLSTARARARARVARGK